MLCSTADNTTLTWWASVTTHKIWKWSKMGRTKTFGLDSCTMNGSGSTKAALHSENGVMGSLEEENAQLMDSTLNKY